MGCGCRVTVTIEFGLLSFLTLQETIKTKMYLSDNKRNQNSWNTYEMKKRRCCHALHKTKCQKPSP